MKKTLLLLALFFSLSFSTCSAAYYTFRLAAPADNFDLKYADDQLYFSFGLARKNPDRLFIAIYNRTQEAVKADWSKASLIFGQKAHSVLPGSQIRADYNNYSAVSAASIPPATVIEESLLVESSLTLRSASPIVIGGGFGGFGGFHRSFGGWIGFDDFYRSASYRGWKIQPFFPSDQADYLPGGFQFSLFLPITVNGTETNYRFTFELASSSMDNSPGVLGLSVTDRREQEIFKKPELLEKGALIIALSKKSAAKAAGLLPGDTIIKMDDRDINDTNDLSDFLSQKSAKEIVQITFLRQGAEKTLPVKLGKL